MDWQTLEEYLVGVGAKVDQKSFNQAREAVQTLDLGLVNLAKKGAQLLGISLSIKSIGKALWDTTVGVAKADMEYQKLAASMWTTKETAKALSVAMKTMGVSQDDIAWVPELREQFFRLRGEMQKFATPADADAQLRYIRDIGYDVQVLFIRLKMLKEWIAYYLIKYLEPYIEDFRAFLNWLLDKLGTDMPGLARTVSRAISMVLQPALATIKALGLAIGKVYDFIVSLPDNVKKWVAVFAAVGAIIMAGPFGALLAGLSMAMILIEDFVGYMNGWNSSATLAPIWEALLKFSEGTGSEWLDDYKTKLTEIVGILEYFVKELRLDEVIQSIKEAVLELGKGLADLWKGQKRQIESLLKMFGLGLPTVRTFFGTIATGISTAIKNMAEFVKLVGRVLQAAALIKEGKFSEAAGLVKDSVIDFGKALITNRRKFYGKIKDMFTGGGSGADVVNNASQFEQGTQWMDPTGENTDSRNQCASFASQMMASAGVDVEPTMNGDLLAGQFKSEGAYHPKGDGYQPQPGDLIDWAHHVGIYAGNGEYIARNSSGGVQRGSMFGMEQYFGSLWGFGSVSELQAAKGHSGGGGDSTTGNIAAGMLKGIGLDTSAVGMAPAKDSYAASVASMGGAGYPATVGGGFGDGAGYGNYTFGGSTVNIYVKSTSATPEEIGSAAKSGVEQGMNETLHIMQRFGRRAEV